MNSPTRLASVTLAATVMDSASSMPFTATCHMAGSMHANLDITLQAGTHLHRGYRTARWALIAMLVVVMTPCENQSADSHTRDLDPDGTHDLERYNCITHTHTELISHTRTLEIYTDLDITCTSTIHKHTDQDMRTLIYVSHTLIDTSLTHDLRITHSELKSNTDITPTLISKSHTQTIQTH